MSKIQRINQVFYDSSNLQRSSYVEFKDKIVILGTALTSLP